MSDHALTRPHYGPRYPLAAGLAFLAAIAFLAGAIHIVTVLLVPAFARSDGWSRLSALAGADQFAEIPVAASAGGVAGLDPLFVNGACRLQLGAAPAGITLDAQDRFWSLALYDPRGTILFSINDRTAAEGGLDMLVVNAEQNRALQTAPPAGIADTVVVESESDDLVALLRLYAPTAANQRQAKLTLAQAECVPSPLDGPADATLGPDGSGGQDAPGLPPLPTRP